MRHNAILVSKGYSYVHVFYYKETFAPVAKMDSIRLVLAITASKGWQVHHMDVRVHSYMVRYRNIYTCSNLKVSKRILHLFVG